MKSLLKYFKGYLRETILGPVFKLLEAIFELCVPLIIAHLVDQVIPKKETSAVVMTVGVLFLFASFGVVVAITAQYFSSKAAVGFTREMTKDLYENFKFGNPSHFGYLSNPGWDQPILAPLFESTDYCLWFYHHGLHHQS